MNIFKQILNSVRYRDVRSIVNLKGKRKFAHLPLTEAVLRSLLLEEETLVKHFQENRAMVLACWVEGVVKFFVINSDSNTFINLVNAASYLKSIGIYPMAIRKKQGKIVADSLFTTEYKDYNIDKINIALIKEVKTDLFDQEMFNKDEYCNV